MDDIYTESIITLDSGYNTLSNFNIDYNISVSSHYIVNETQDNPFYYNVYYETDMEGNLNFNIKPIEVTISWVSPFSDRLFDQLREIEIDKNWDRTKQKELKNFIFNSISEKLNRFIELEDIDESKILEIEIRFNEVFIKLNVLRNNEYEEYYRTYPYISTNYGLR